MNKIKKDLIFLYNKNQGEKTYKKIEQLISKYKNKIIKPGKKVFKNQKLSNKDTFLITYANQFQIENKFPLEILNKACKKYLKRIISGIHILPFFPYSSDEGFSVIDYKKVNSEFGNWHHICWLSENFKLMIDLVCNHISAKSDWFQGFLNQDESYKNFFIEMAENTDISGVVRPRTSNLLTPFKTCNEVCLDNLQQ